MSSKAWSTLVLALIVIGYFTLQLVGAPSSPIGQIERRDRTLELADSLGPSAAPSSERARIEIGARDTEPGMGAPETTADVPDSATFSGRVVDESGAPIEGASVSCRTLGNALRAQSWSVTFRRVRIRSTGSPTSRRRSRTGTRSMWRSSPGYGRRSD